MGRSAKTIRFHQPGGPEVLTSEEVSLAPPGPRQVLIEHKAIGVNYADIYLRSGVSPAASLPSGIGTEAAGVIEAIGPDVTNFKVGDRVVYAKRPVGSYAEARLYPVDELIHLPDDIPFTQAASMMVRGMTAEYLVRRAYAVQKGDAILVHAAAGGVGAILCQWAKHLGATVIGTVGSDAKVDFARRHGCDHAIVYGRGDFSAEVKALTGGRGVAVVYDSVGKDVWKSSLASLKPRGSLITIGAASGPIPPFTVNDLQNSIYVSRASLQTYTSTRDELLASAGALFEVVRSGHVKIETQQTYKLANVATAHRDMENRRNVGSTVLLP